MGQLSWLTEAMAEVPDQTAIVWEDRGVTYADLIDAMARWDRNLDEAEVVVGSVVAVIGDYHPEAIGCLLALIDRAAIVVPLTEVTAPQHEEFLAVAEAQHLIRFSDEDTWTFERLEVEVEHPLLTGLAAEGHPGLIVFSSGSTGRSKGMLHDLTRTLESSPSAVRPS